MEDRVNPTGKWEFNEEVTNCFDNMLQRSIPAYPDMRELVRRIGFQYVKPDTAIIDLGCSNGIAIEPFIKRFEDDCKYYLLDVSEPMLNACREKYKDLDYVYVQKHNITEGLPNQTEASVILSVLTLQFTPIEYRQAIVQSVYNGLKKGGAFIFVEKVLGNTNELDSLMVDQYYTIKAEHAYTQEQIKAKRKSLEGVLVPITAKWNEELLLSVGFSKIDCFWRYLNFAGWIALK